MEASETVLIHVQSSSPAGDSRPKQHELDKPDRLFKKSRKRGALQEIQCAREGGDKIESRDVKLVASQKHASLTLKHSIKTEPADVNSEHRAFYVKESQHISGLSDATKAGPVLLLDPVQLQLMYPDLSQSIQAQVKQQSHQQQPQPESPTSSTMVKPYALESHPSSILPNLNDEPGPYGFKVSLDPKEDTLKAPNWLMSRITRKLYTNMNKSIPFRIILTKRNLGVAYYLRVMAVFNSHQYMRVCVTRCPNHSKPTDPTNAGFPYPAHVVRVDHPQAVYEQSPSGQLSLVIPLEFPSDTGEASPVLLSFMCLCSCVGGINRRPLAIAMILEVNGAQVGRRIIDVRVCACPTRDFKNEEQQIISRGLKRVQAIEHARGKKKQRPNSNRNRKSGLDGIYYLPVCGQKLFNLLKDMKALYLKFHPDYAEKYPDPSNDMLKAQIEEHRDSYSSENDEEDECNSVQQNGSEAVNNDCDESQFGQDYSKEEHLYTASSSPPSIALPAVPAPSNGLPAKPVYVIYTNSPLSIPAKLPSQSIPVSLSSSQDVSMVNKVNCIPIPSNISVSSSGPQGGMCRNSVPMIAPTVTLTSLVPPSSLRTVSLRTDLSLSASKDHEPVVVKKEQEDYENLLSEEELAPPFSVSILQPTSSAVCSKGLAYISRSKSEHTEKLLVGKVVDSSSTQQHIPVPYAQLTAPVVRQGIRTLVREGVQTVMKEYTSGATGLDNKQYLKLALTHCMDFDNDKNVDKELLAAQVLASNMGSNK